MRVLIIVLLLGGLAIVPFVYLRKPWALRIWQRIRLVVVIYVLVIVLAAVLRLLFNWEDIYG